MQKTHPNNQCLKNPKLILWIVNFAGESEPPESDEDTYIKSDKKLKRVKSAFVDDEASEDENEANEDIPEKPDENEDDFHLSLADDEDEDTEELSKKPETEMFATPSLETGKRSSWQIASILWIQSTT